MTSTLAPLDVIFVRHAEAVAIGTSGYAEDDRPLTERGQRAATELALELDGFDITAIYCSPYPRAVATLEPLARARNLEVQLIDDLRERRLTTGATDDWRALLDRAWADADWAHPGAESGSDAQRRAMATLDLLRSRHADGGRIVLGSHGNLISLVLQALEPGVDAAFHLAMPTPAIYRLTHDGLRWRVMGGFGFTPLEEPSSGADARSPRTGS